MTNCRIRYVQRGIFDGLEWMRSHGSGPEGLVLAPPLIGGHALQQLGMLRPLVRRNLDLLSFNYAGHGASRGVFSVQAALHNCLVALDLALHQSHQEGLRLYGVASCFAALPMLHAIGLRGEPMTKLVLINALPHLCWERLALSFGRYWWRNRPRRPTLRNLILSLRAFRDELLPGVEHRHQAFGILSRRRIHWSRCILDILTSRRMRSSPLRRTPVLCIYGKRDRLLGRIGFDDWSRYERMISGICPRTRFKCLDSGHFMTGGDLRRRLLDSILRFLSAGGGETF